ncbi:hypothetical protein G6F46_007244 [Rhizopus delemar]|uniref:DASH complex subunit SPC19 n=1 Tax=Rhizopus oryzae TaxID=64495 RepID=A0A9P6Y8K1_RHIOR|nr:hypothetical protein G6F55_008400 [Rhizopus delemar]KAG1542066.1 hypothetical protein G6F51_007507 [Rhizopus arrhizus]KAG1494783.1 hypothetical protein G6F54_007632 [Rhizopus delemar]KAG1509947.1 hypothetical protein G6F53_007056 [Rhizopus delemar]KAG1522737.1 hypothetical protein G6F52_005606 [Rhizopus delemar]
MSSSRLEHVERLENRERSENEEPWQEPYDLRENLTGSVICLDKTLNALRNINSTLGSTIDHFKGQSKLTRYTRHSELFMQTDVDSAHQAIAPNIQEEIERQLSVVRLYMMKQEDEQEHFKVQIQRQRSLKKELEAELEQAIEKNKKREEQQASSQQSFSESVDLQKKNKRTQKQMEEIEQLCVKEEKEVEEIELAIAELQANRMRVTLGQGQDARRKYELQSELDRLEDQLAGLKEKEEAVKRVQGTANELSSDSTITLGSVSQYKGQLALIEDAIIKLQKINPTTSTLVDCERVCSEYLKSLEAEKLLKNYAKHYLNMERRWVEC